MSKCVCQICGNKYDNLSKHIKPRHGITIDEYKIMYPGCKLVSEEYSIKRSEIAINMYDDDHRSNQAHNASVTLRARNLKNWSDPNYRSYISQVNSDKAKKQWEDDSFRESMIPVVLKNIETKNNIQYFEYNGKTYKFRSKLEKSLITKLLECNVSFEYESLKIRYFDPVKQSHRTYIPDIYIRDINLIIEIKPHNKIDDIVVISKYRASIDEGYNYEFVSTITEINEIVRRFNDYRNHS